MSGKVLPVEILQRVEHMLGALDVREQSSSDFKSGCDALQVYLDSQAEIFTPNQILSVDSQQRLKLIIKQLDELQKRAESKAAIPSDLQKYIAERED